MALTDLLALATNNYSDTDRAWRQLVDDHKTYLINGATRQLISPSYFQGVRFDIQRLLRNINYDVSCYWIVQLINNIPNDIYFDAITLVLLPDMTAIQMLYTEHISTQQPAR